MKYTVALAGNPNCGKTTLFNQLTGSNQYVGNWAGVTVEKKEGSLVFNGSELNIVDLPGIYSLSAYTMEEIISRDFIIGQSPDLILNIIDGTNIERNMYLTLQLMELSQPMVIAVNMMDDVEAKGGKINCEKLSQKLGVPVVPIAARKKKNIDGLISVIEKVLNKQLISLPHIEYDMKTQAAINDIIILLSENNNKYLGFYAGKLLENDKQIMFKLKLTEKQLCEINKVAEKYEKVSEYGDRETMLADSRYRYISLIASETVIKHSAKRVLTVSDKIDLFVTNRVLAIPIFLAMMFLMFNVTFGAFGSYLKGLVELFVKNVISNGAAALLNYLNAPQFAYGLIVDAVIGGVGAILAFLPQILLLFLFLSILEDSGYMARAAFIMDRPLRKLGLTGKSFIPMLMGFGCTTPAVMSARTMENENDRRMTIMLTPFMSCGARLPIYGLFAGAFFSKNQGLIVFSMYIIGMAAAILSGIFLKHTLFKDKSSAFIMELPAYRMPTLKGTLMHIYEKAKGFIIKAGTIIFSMSVLIWLLQNFGFDLKPAADSADSIFGRIGTFIAPVFIPLGFGKWQAAVALLAGLIAKESVVSTLTVLYGTVGSDALNAVLLNEFTPLSAFSFMVFCLLYMPCVSAFVTITKEMNSLKWSLGTAAYLTLVAYFVSMLIYQIGSMFIL